MNIPVSLRMNVLHSNLESIEAASFRDLNFLHEARGQVLIDNAITSSEESKYTRNEVLLICIEFLIPVNQVWY